jgi:hypothetical protein
MWLYDLENRGVCVEIRLRGDGDILLPWQVGWTSVNLRDRFRNSGLGFIVKSEYRDAKLALSEKNRDSTSCCKIWMCVNEVEMMPCGSPSGLSVEVGRRVSLSCSAGRRVASPDMDNKARLIV